ncbi:MAG: hypothetical protein AMJ68_04135 [Acidithiobacillales bacterium SG8_45]|jgi:mono/diheme cytochrome c family protein|nr:MAG: hypothetical protein AMJ68_04135 [Acidithiobacillales bacterium SG8_45]
MKQFYIGLLCMALLTGCGSNDKSAQDAQAPKAFAEATYPRLHDPALIEKGFRVYRKNCGTCHGDSGQGAPDWQKPGPDGKYPPPPLNGTGHAWHHPQAALVRTIRHGTIAIGGKMPAWGDKLSDEDIAAVIAWFQSRWPDELYQAWARMDQQSRQN